MFSCNPIVVRFGLPGDEVSLTPLVHLLHRRYGLPSVVLGCGSWMKRLPAGHPDVQAVLPVAHPGWPYWLDPTQRAAAQILRERLQGAVYVCDDDASGRTYRFLRRAGIHLDQCRFANPDCPPRKAEHWADRWHRFAQMTPPAFAASAWRANDHSDP
jgi:hypothetical protein